MVRARKAAQDIAISILSNTQYPALVALAVNSVFRGIFHLGATPPSNIAPNIQALQAEVQKHANVVFATEVDEVSRLALNSASGFSRAGQ